MVNTAPPARRTPAVSVILPTYNRSGPLRRAVRSVLDQGFGDLELIVVDDGSEEDVAAALRDVADPRLRHVRRHGRGGPAAARNSGVAVARGPLLAFQDSDDEWLPGKLERQVRALHAAGDRHMVVCGVLRETAAGVRQFPPANLRARPTLGRTDVLRHPFAYAQSWLVPRDAVTAAGGFDEALGVWEDWELLIRLSARLGIVLLADPLVRAPQTADSISLERGRFIHAMERILQKHGAGVDAPTLAGLRYAQARLFAATGRCRESRQAAALALRLRPGHWRAAALLAASVLGPDWLARLVRRVEARR